MAFFFLNGHFILGFYVLYYVTFTFKKQSLLGLTKEQFCDVTACFVRLQGPARHRPKDLT